MMEEGIIGVAFRVKFDSSIQTAGYELLQNNPEALLKRSNELGKKKRKEEKSELIPPLALHEDGSVKKILKKLPINWPGY